MFLSSYPDTAGDTDSVYPLSLYVRIDAHTTLDQIKESWDEIKYWGDYIRRNQGAQMGGWKDNFLYDLHEKNLNGKGYGTLAKEANEKVEKSLRLKINSEIWIKDVRQELQESFPNVFSKIIKNLEFAFRLPPAIRKFKLDKIHKENPIRSLANIPETNPFDKYDLQALEILMALKFKKTEGEILISKAMEDIKQGNDMKKMISEGKIRETLRSWRKNTTIHLPAGKGRDKKTFFSQRFGG
jgi:hypothetical protein